MVIGPQQASQAPNFSPAFYRDSSQVTIFPLDGPAFSVPAAKIKGFRVSSPSLLSPDGQRELKFEHWQMRVHDKGTGVDVILKNAWPCAWSPDGKLLACDRDHKIVLFDANELSVKRQLGSAGVGGLDWSPDSTRLLIRTSSPRCWATLYFENLTLVDVTTGKRKEVKSAHCNASAGKFGWVDTATMQWY